MRGGNYRRRNTVFLSFRKMALFFSIPKKGEKSCRSKYLPIAITSLITKTIETIINNQLLIFHETRNLLFDQHYGFRISCSSGGILTYAVHVWSSALESYGQIRVISLELPKALDRCWCKGLIPKLSMFALQHTLITWIASFPSDRPIASSVESSSHSSFSPVLLMLFINVL